MNKFLCLFIPIMSSSLVVLLTGYFKSTDGKDGWLPFLLLSLVLSTVISLLMIVVNKVRPQSNAILLTWGIAIAVINLIFGLLFYFYPIDWLAINEGREKLSLFQEIIFSDLLPWGLVILYPVLFFASKFLKSNPMV